MAPPHDLFGDADWRDTLVHLYSFSKVFCLTGYRVGAIIAGPRLNAEIAKAMDTVAICAPRIGQVAALDGLRAAWASGARGNTDDDARAAVGAARRRLRRNDLGYELISAGAYFAYLRHPFDGRPAADGGAAPRRPAEHPLPARQHVRRRPG